MASRFRFKSLRQQFLLGFMAISILILMLGLTCYFLFSTISKISSIKDLSYRQQVHILQIINIDNDFLDFETTNENYFKTGKSSYLSNRDSVLKLLRSEQVILQHELKNSFLSNLSAHSDRVDSLFTHYNNSFIKLESLIRKRGFKDFGMEGEMRFFAHELEALYSNSDKSKLLMLRRHEKDFLLRHDTVYVQAFNNLIDSEIARLSNDPRTNKVRLENLKNYKSEFNKRKGIEIEIGLSSINGLRFQLNELSHQLNLTFSKSLANVKERYDLIAHWSIILLISLVIVSIILALIISFWISQKLSLPIVKLANWVNATTLGRKVITVSQENEIDLLKKSFINLIKRTRKQMNEIKEKSNLIDKKNQELIKLNSELDHFLYSTAHDLRSPLSSLNGLINLMFRENRQQEFVVYLQMMQSNIKRQEDFIAQIVSYAKNSKMEVVPEKIDPQKLVLEIFQNHEFIEGASEIQKYISLKADVDFYSDRNRLNIIFNNLISNAIRYSDPQKGEHRMIEINLAINQDNATIHFKDNGIGIEEAYLDKIFNMFYRANFQSKGSGLGLFILKEAITKLEGEVKVKSLYKSGTEFHITLPNHYRRFSGHPDASESEKNMLVGV